MNTKECAVDNKIYEEALLITGMTYHMNSDYISKSDYFEAVYSELQQKNLASKN